MDLKVKSVIGFSGKVPNSLHYTPCGGYVVYPLGSLVVVKNVRTDKETFLDGHTSDISCLKISHDGRTAATGQLSSMGVKAVVIVWDIAKCIELNKQGSVIAGDDCCIHRLMQHLGKVQDVDFSMNDDYLCTLGGQDDNAIVVWNTMTGEALCGAPAAADSVYAVKWLNGRNDRIVSAGAYNLRVWQADFGQPKLYPLDAKLGNVRRVITCLTITEDDHFAYCGTQTGDVLKVKIDRNEIAKFNDPDTTIPVMAGCSKERFPKGATSILCVTNPRSGNHNVLVGAGNGVVTYLNPQLNSVADGRSTLMGGVMSVCKHPSKNCFIIGTDQCNRYEVSQDLKESELRSSCHFGSVNDVAFPDGCPDLIVTSSTGDIRVWNVRIKQELLRIQVPNLDCLCSLVSPSGSAIVSGWNDGKIRAFYPETGRMRFVIADAHAEKVTAVAVADNDNRGPWRIVSGGSEGRVRIWNVTSSHQSLISSLKEHRGPVNCLKITKDSRECISASSDGSCIVWDLERYVRLRAMFEPNVFTSVLYHPDESQVLTCGTNGNITYWDASDGQAIRVINGGTVFLQSLDVDPHGEFFVCGGHDKLLTLWHYDDGLPVAVGRGHSGVINAVKISPDQKSIVSVGSNGEIIFWEMPKHEELKKYLIDE